jgi:beta-galactosidase
MWMLRSRQLSGNPRDLEFTGSLQTQPQLLEAWGRTSLQLQRLAKYITLFPQLERQVKILYSESSAIQQNSLENSVDENFIAAPDDDIFANYVMQIYEALYFLDYQVGFTTEAMIADQGLKNCKLLVIPNAQYVSQITVNAIKCYREQGGTVAIIGKDALKYDEYGNARDITRFINAKNIYLQGSSAEEYSPQLDHLMTKAGVSRSIRALDSNGDNAWGVEMRVAEKAGRKIFYLINLNKKTIKIILKMKQAPQQAFELISRRIIDISKPLILEPRKPVMILLKKKYNIYT